MSSIISPDDVLFIFGNPDKCTSTVVVKGDGVNNKVNRVVPNKQADALAKLMLKRNKPIEGALKESEIRHYGKTKRS